MSKQNRKPPRSRSRRRAEQFEIMPIRPDLLPAVWEHVAPHLSAAVDQSEGLLTLDDVAEAALTGEMLVWLVSQPKIGKITAAFTTRFIAYPAKSALAIDLVGGSELSRWHRMALSKITEYAKSIGCDHLEGYGRAAWGRILQSDGWRTAYQAFYRDL